MIKLSYEDHWLAHKLLAEENTDNEQLVNAFKHLGTKENFIARCNILASEEHRVHTIENHADMSGKNNPMYGRHHTKEKMSVAAVQGFKTGVRDTRGVKNGMYGKHISEEAKKKQSEAMKGENNPMYRKTGVLKGKHWKLVNGKRVYY